MIELDKACVYLITKSYPSYNKDTCGRCAAAVRTACDFGFGRNLKKFPSAKDYGPAYEQIGFKKILSYPAQPKGDYKPESGDICILQATKKHPDGHICMYTSKGWISDFKQRDMYGGSIRDEDPKFDIYRHIFFNDQLCNVDHSEFA